MKDTTIALPSNTFNFPEKKRFKNAKRGISTLSAYRGSQLPNQTNKLYPRIQHKRLLS
jgi:hypothetical protein